MLRALNRHLRWLPFRFGGRQDARSFRPDSRFASFLAQSNRRRFHPDRHDAILRGRKFMRRLLGLATAAAAIWFALESAHALTVF